MALYHTKTALELCFAKYRFAARHASAGFILDLACGDGIGTMFLAAETRCRIFGGDISATMLERASRYAGNGCKFVQMDALRIPFSDSVFDLVVSIETIEHLNHQERFLAECCRVLKCGGYFACSTVNREVFSPSRKGPWFPGHVRELSVIELHDLLQRFFVDIALYGVPWNPNFGPIDRILLKGTPLWDRMFFSSDWGARILRALTKLRGKRYDLIRLEGVHAPEAADLNYELYSPFPIDPAASNIANVIAIAKKEVIGACDPAGE